MGADCSRYSLEIFIFQETVLLFVGFSVDGVNDVEGMLFGFHEYSGYVFSDDPYCEELDAAEEEDGDHDGGETLHWIAVKDGFDQNVEQVD